MRATNVISISNRKNSLPIEGFSVEIVAEGKDFQHIRNLLLYILYSELIHTYLLKIYNNVCH